MREFDISKIDFSKLQDPRSGEFLVPAVVDVRGRVAMVGFMNEEALAKTVAEDKVTFFSRTTGKLWTKGETSGNYLVPNGIFPDCDNDTLLIEASANGSVCHTGAETCFDIPDELAQPLPPIRPDLQVLFGKAAELFGPSWQDGMFF